MPLPTIADVFRVAFEWTGPQGLATNVMHFRDTSGAEVDVYNNIAAAVSADMWALTSNSATIDEIVVTKLDGSPVGHIYSTGSGAEWDGSGGTDYIPQACALVKLNTLAGGRRGSGRVFLPWIAEGNQSGGIVNSTQQALVQAAWESFLADTSAAGSFLCVASYAGSTSSDVQTLKVENFIATQRRRLHRH